MSAFLAHLIHSPERGLIERVDDALVLVSADGTIERVVPGGFDPAAKDLRGQGVLVPGFVDLHIHAPQFPQLGAALDAPLEDWLFKYTFPLESRFADLNYAAGVYRALVARLLSLGTTTAVYFATIHLPASLELARICVELGQRAIVGRVAMDLASGCPDYYRDADAQASVDETARFITAVRSLDGNALVEPAVTPRFIPACSNHALEGLGTLAAETGVPVQTHCSESDWEHAHVIERMGMTDTAALDQFGLLTGRTVLAHCGFVSGGDLDLIKDRGACIAHCPLSNTFFANAVLPLRMALEKAVHVGLGTDISGGPSAFLLDNARAAVVASRMLEDGVDPNLPSDRRGAGAARIDFRDAFWMATRGGALAIDLPVGCFAPGLQFDAVLVDLADDAGPPEDHLQKIVMRATAEDLRSTWVAGRLVSSKTAFQVQNS
ncbi:MAG: amidohydrolase family protein [Pseudomonadota bacterium]